MAGSCPPAPAPPQTPLGAGCHNHHHGCHDEGCAVVMGFAGHANAPATGCAGHASARGCVDHAGVMGCGCAGGCGSLDDRPDPPQETPGGGGSPPSCQTPRPDASPESAPRDSVERMDPPWPQAMRACCDCAAERSVAVRRSCSGRLNLLAECWMPKSAPPALAEAFPAAPQLQTQQTDAPEKTTSKIREVSA